MLFFPPGQNKIIYFPQPKTPQTHQPLIIYNKTEGQISLDESCQLCMALYVTKYVKSNLLCCLNRKPCFTQDN